MPEAPHTARKNLSVTAIVGRFHAGQLSVCREGSVVALHFDTSNGRVIVTMGERGFVQSARSPKDFHGHPFRTIEQLDAELRCDGPVPGVTETRGGAFRQPDPAQLDKLHAAWKLFLSGAALTCESAAKMGGVSYPTLTEYIRQNYADQARTLRRERMAEVRAKRKELAIA